MPGEGRVGDVEDGSVDNADDRDAREAEGDRDAEHGEKMGVIHCAIEGVHDPGRRGGDEVRPGAAGTVRFFADEAGRF